MSKSRKTLVIDPEIVWTTYYGGKETDVIEGICSDVNGNIGVTGHTNSISSIATTGAFQTAFQGVRDAFVVKLNGDGNRIWGSYFGGKDHELGGSISANGGSFVITGHSYSKEGITTSGAHQEQFGGGISNTIIVKFNDTGQLEWATYYSGQDNDWGNSINTDEIGNIYITGEARSSLGISSDSSHQKTYGGGVSDVFVAKFSRNGKLLWGTYYGGSGIDRGISIGTDVEGNVYILGTTQSLSSISTVNAHQVNYGGGNSDAFIAKFDNNGNRIWGTYYGGSYTDYGASICIDAYNNIIISGSTRSQMGITTAGTHKDLYDSSQNQDAFIAKFTSNGERLWGSYYGGNNSDRILAITVDSRNNILVCGDTRSETGIANYKGFKKTYTGQDDAFLAKFNTNGLIEWGTYYGGSNLDKGLGIIADIHGYIYTFQVQHLAPLL